MWGLLGVLPGFRLLRRAVTLALIGGAFWAGVEYATLLQTDACLDAGGRWDTRGFCDGASG